MLDYFWNWGRSQSSEFCRKEFPQVYSGFIDYLRDTLHAQGPAYHSPAQQEQAAGEPLPLRLPAVSRLVAIGDLHGDFGKTQRAFRLAGLIDSQDRWCGGTTTAVQVGDQLDRGANEVRILYWLERLQEEAKKSGGALHILNGNHETLNTHGRFTYATPEGMQDFAVWKILEDFTQKMKGGCGCALPSSAPSSPPTVQEADTSRRAAVAPGGEIAKRFFAPHPVVLQVGSTLFVHGGVLPKHTEYGLERINKETREWFLGESGPKIPSFLSGKDAVVWARDYSTEKKEKCNCAALQQALEAVPGAERMVVGHTIQAQGINTACDNKVYRIDVGLSKGCGNGPPEVLEILNDKECRSLHETNEPKMLVEDAIAAKEQERSQESTSRGGYMWNWFGAEKRQQYQ